MAATLRNFVYGDVVMRSPVEVAPCRNTALLAVAISAVVSVPRFAVVFDAWPAVDATVHSRLYCATLRLSLRKDETLGALP